jgi:paraquat-inducible protein B
MSPAKPIVVGSFILGALALGVVAILVFGGMKLFTRHVRVVVVFAGSVAGLEVGSPVTLRGVPIGRVEGMSVRADVISKAIAVPVYLDIEPRRISWKEGPAEGSADIPHAVELGLRAQLVSQSLITGELNVNLDFHTGGPAVRSQSVDGVVEIPTIPSNLEDLEEEFRKLNLPDLGVKMRETLVDLQRVLDNLQSRIGPTADDLHETLTSATAAVRGIQADTHRSLGHIDQLVEVSRGQVSTDGKDLDELLKTADRTASQAEQLLKTLNEVTGSDSPMRADLAASLRDLAASASSLRSFSRDFERNPTGTLLERHTE